MNSRERKSQHLPTQEWKTWAPEELVNSSLGAVSAFHTQCLFSYLISHPLYMLDKKNNFPTLCTVKPPESVSKVKK